MPLNTFPLLVEYVCVCVRDAGEHHMMLQLKEQAQNTPLCDRTHQGGGGYRANYSFILIWHMVCVCVSLRYIFLRSWKSKPGMMSHLSLKPSSLVIIVDKNILCCILLIQTW